MKKSTGLKICVTAVALCALPAASWAGNSCARPDETAALKAAALQQQLMVAALTCSDVPLYNRFVISYRTELQQSDSALLGYFHRVNARTGEADYHAYKTRLANQASLNSIHDPDYCATARAEFDDARQSSNLAELVASQPISGVYATCSDDTTVAESVRGGSFRLPRSARTADRRN